MAELEWLSTDNPKGCWVMDLVLGKKCEARPMTRRSRLLTGLALLLVVEVVLSFPSVHWRA